MTSHAHLWEEFMTLLRGMKDLSATAIAGSGVRIELAGAHLLSRISELGGVRLTDLAAGMGLDPSSVSRQVTALERSGWVAREEDPTDRRASRLTVTRAGRDVVAALTLARTEALARLTPDWSDTDLDTLAASLGRLNHDLATRRDQLHIALENA
jgi:DNA-binding MarR family transcriptional regulator